MERVCWWLDHQQYQVPHKRILNILEDLRGETQMETFQQLLGLKEFDQLKDAYTKFANDHNGPMKQFWGSYLHMVSLLPQFI